MEAAVHRTPGPFPSSYNQSQHIPCHIKEKGKKESTTTTSETLGSRIPSCCLTVWECLKESSCAPYTRSLSFSLISRWIWIWAGHLSQVGIKYILVRAKLELSSEAILNQANYNDNPEPNHLEIKFGTTGKKGRGQKKKKEKMEPRGVEPHPAA
jgi:hypothetical protein